MEKGPHPHPHPNSHPRSQSWKEPNGLLSAGLIVFALLSYFVTNYFNYVSGSARDKFFISTVGETSGKYSVYITPAGSTFAIWGLIYTWLGASWTIFTLTIFLVSPKGGRLYQSPAIATPAVATMFAFNMASNVTWLFASDRSSASPGLIFVASLILLQQVITNCLSSAFLASNISSNLSDFVRGAPLFWWGVAYRLALNGLATYTTWTVVAYWVNLTQALVYSGGLDQTSCCLWALSLLTLSLAVWFVLENTVWDSYTRYVVTPYPVVIWASYGIRSSIMAREDVPQEIHTFAMAILVIGIIALAARVLLLIYRKPLLPSEYSALEDMEAVEDTPLKQQQVIMFA